MGGALGRGLNSIGQWWDHDVRGMPCPNYNVDTGQGGGNGSKSSTGGPWPRDGSNVGGRINRAASGEVPPAANPPPAPTVGAAAARAAGAGLDAGTGVINGFVDSLIKPFRVNRGPIYGNDGAFANGVTVGKWLALRAQAALFVAGVVGLAAPRGTRAAGGAATADRHNRDMAGAGRLC